MSVPVRSTSSVPSVLTSGQKLVNAAFAERMFHQLNPNGGVWASDHGRMIRNNGVFMADLCTHQQMQQIMPAWWVNHRVVLLMDLTNL
jgi:hypothetical protein